KGETLWETIMAAGKPYGLQPGHTSTIRRIEGGMLSYHADMDISTNPYELGLDRLVALDIDADFIGKAALKRIRDQGVSRKQVGLEIDGPPLAVPNARFWALTAQGEVVGKVTSAVYSPRLEKNIALAMVSADVATLGARFDVDTPSGTKIATVVEKPFFDPNKAIASSGCCQPMESAQDNARSLKAQALR
ncbi:MAG: glycine cleavage T C-terminal barrel domain-containing protein, partial [Natronospirillum sp.]